MDDFKCLECGRVLGQVERRHLVINGIKVEGACNGSQLRVICSCGVIRKWQPVSKPIAKRDRVVV